MPRPHKPRCCRRYAADRMYKPQGTPLREIEVEVLSLDQFEAMRLCDLEDLDQEETGRRMGVSRGTIQRLLYSGRKQLVNALLKNHAIAVNLKKERETCHAGMPSHQRQCRAERHRAQTLRIGSVFHSVQHGDRGHADCGQSERSS